MKTNDKPKKPQQFRNRLKYTLTMNPAMVEPFRKICDECGISMSRVFEDFIDVFLKTMHPGEDFREEYTNMIAFYYQYRKGYEMMPTALGKEGYKKAVKESISDI